MTMLVLRRGVSEAGAAMVTMLAHMIITKGLAWSLRVTRIEKGNRILTQHMDLTGSYRIQLSLGCDRNGSYCTLHAWRDSGKSRVPIFPFWHCQTLPAGVGLFPYVSIVCCSWALTVLQWIFLIYEEARQAVYSNAYFLLYMFFVFFLKVLRT